MSKQEVGDTAGFEFCVWHFLFTYVLDNEDWDGGGSRMLEISKQWPGNLEAIWQYSANQTGWFNAKAQLSDAGGHQGLYPLVTQRVMQCLGLNLYSCAFKACGPDHWPFLSNPRIDFQLEFSKIHCFRTRKIVQWLNPDGPWHHSTGLVKLANYCWEQSPSHCALLRRSQKCLQEKKIIQLYYHWWQILEVLEPQR